MELMDTCLGKLLAKMKPNPFPEYVIGKIVIAVVTALDYLKTNFSVIHRGMSVCQWARLYVHPSVSVPLYVLPIELCMPLEGKYWQGKTWKLSCIWQKEL